MKDKLKKGQAFIGIDDNLYYFLGYDYDGQVMFTNLDLWTDKEQKYFVKNNLFIKEILEEKSEIIDNATWYYQSLDEFSNSTNDEKIKRCLDIIENENTSSLSLKPTRIGPLVRGQAYSSKVNQFYEVVGFIVENHIYVDGKLKTKQKGFFSIYHSNCDDSVPMIFERALKLEDNSFEGKHFVAGNGDKVDIKEVLVSKEKINDDLTSELNKRFEKNFYDERIF